MYDIDESIPHKMEFGRSLYHETKLARPHPFGAFDPGYGVHHAPRRLGGHIAGSFPLRRGGPAHPAGEVLKFCQKV